MPTFRDVPCVYCNSTFTWQNDFNPHGDPPLCCHVCASRKPVNYTCRFCGKQETNRYINDEKKILLQTCFACAFWIRHLTMPLEGRIITPDYEHLCAGWWGIRKDDTRFLGFGGRTWEVEMLDGTKRLTNNLWSQGDIDPVWRPRFTPNVKYLKEIQIYATNS